MACGQGLATRALVGAGATSVTGVVSAEPMIALARQRTEPAAPVSYVVDDATHLVSFADGAVDGVTCQLGLMDIGDLDATVVAAWRVLRPGGWFVAITGHPCFLATRDRRAAQPATEQLVAPEHFWIEVMSGLRAAANRPDHPHQEARTPDIGLGH